MSYFLWYQEFPGIPGISYFILKKIYAGNQSVDIIAYTRNLVHMDQLAGSTDHPDRQRLDIVEPYMNRMIIRNKPQIRIIDLTFTKR